MLPSAGVTEHLSDLSGRMGEHENPESLGDLVTQ